MARITAWLPWNSGLGLSRDTGHQGLPGKLPGWWMVDQMPQGEAKSLLDLMGNMAPSESFLARLPRKLNEQWESRRKTFESMKKP